LKKRTSTGAPSVSTGSESGVRGRLHRLATNEHRWWGFCVALLRTCAVLALFVGGLLIFATVYTRSFGLPTPLKDRLRYEIEQRGLIIRFDRLFINQLGAIEMRGAQWFDRKNESELCRIDRVVVGVRWLSWWQEAPLIESIEVDGAQLAVPLDEGEVAEFQDVMGKISWNHDALELEFFEARILSVRFHATGRFDTKSLESHERGHSLVKEEKKTSPVSYGRLWRSVRQAVASVEVGGLGLAEIEASINVGGPGELSEVKASLHLPPFSWRGVAADGLSGRASWNGERVRIEDWVLSLGEGELSVSGQADLKSSRLELRADSTLDPARFSPLLQGEGRLLLEALRFEVPPLSRIVFKYDWGKEKDWRVDADIDWRGVVCRGSRIDRLRIPLAMGGGRYLIPEATLEASGQTLQAKMIYEEGQRMEARISGGILFPQLKGFAPEGAQAFLNSCTLNAPFQPDITFKGTGWKSGEWKGSGSILAGKGSYKGTEMEGLSAKLHIAPPLVRATDVVLTRSEGKATAAEVLVDSEKHTVTLKDVVTRTMVQETSKMFGPVLENALKPYVFPSPPTVNLSGVVDLLEGGKGTKLDIRVNGKGLRYPFLGVILPGENIEAKITMEGHWLTINNLTAGLYKGTLRGTAKFDLSKPEGPFTTDMVAQGMDFALLMENLFKAGGVSGIFSGEGRFSGLTRDPRALRGDGCISIEEGYLIGIPFMGGLSALINTIIPDLGYAKAKEASGTFTTSGGVIHSPDLTMRSVTFTIIGDGTYDYLADALDMNARVNVRGVFGVMMFPVSKLFEYHGTGPLRDARWSPKILGN
jgi:hypothetical protein